MPFIGFGAAALATTLAGWVMVWQLWRGVRGMGDAARMDARLRHRLPRIALASGVMGAVLWGLSEALAPMLATAGLRYGALALLVFGGIVTYFGTGGLIGAFRMSDFGSALRRKKKG
jgi:putative peptidoglycan lipid II flippase